MKTIYYFLLCLCFSACNNSENLGKEKGARKISLTNLKGNWSTNSLGSQVSRGERSILLSIYNNHECYFTPGLLLEYKINGDTMKIMDKFSLYEFKICMREKDKLSLLPIGHTKKAINEFVYGSWSLREQKEKIIDILYFHRVVKQNTIEVNEVLFRSSQCQGGCESIYLRIDNSCNVEYFGGAFVKKLGGYSGCISKIELQNLIDQIHLLNLDEIKENYPSTQTDNQSWDIIIKYNQGKEIHTNIKSIGLEPTALRALINELQAMPINIKMTKDKEINPMSFIELGQPYVMVIEE
jgi:hypothetical protein